MAKRLVSTALGIKNTVSPEQRKMERQMLADAKGTSIFIFGFAVLSYLIINFDLIFSKKATGCSAKRGRLGRDPCYALKMTLLIGPPLNITLYIHLYLYQPFGAPHTKNVCKLLQTLSSYKVFSRL